MAKPKTDLSYARQLATMAEEGWKPPRIFRELEQQAQAEGRDDHPSERTVRRLYEEWKQQPEAVRRQHARFHWPGSMEEGALPWEASRAALDLLRSRGERDMERPRVSEARWFWRLRLASPTLSDIEADLLASQLAFREYIRVAKRSGEFRTPTLEQLFAYEPWSDEAHADRYRQAAARRSLPDYPPHATVGELGDERGLRTYLEHFFGAEAADAAMAEVRRNAAPVEALGQESR